MSPGAGVAVNKEEEGHTFLPIQADEAFVSGANRSESAPDESLTQTPTCVYIDIYITLRPIIRNLSAVVNA